MFYMYTLKSLKIVNIKDITRASKEDGFRLVVPMDLTKETKKRLRKAVVMSMVKDDSIDFPNKILSKLSYRSDNTPRADSLYILYCNHDQYITCGSDVIYKGKEFDYLFFCFIYSCFKYARFLNETYPDKDSKFKVNTLRKEAMKYLRDEGLDQFNVVADNMNGGIVLQTRYGLDCEFVNLRARRDKDDMDCLYDISVNHFVPVVGRDIEDTIKYIESKFKFLNRKI